MSHQQLLRLAAYLFVVVVAMVSVAVYDANQRGSLATRIVKIERTLREHPTVVQRKVILRGSRGLSGAAGKAGTNGIGLPGAQGSRGQSGRDGAQGVQGQRGLRGEKGDRGQPGIPGVSPSVAQIVAAVCARLPLGLCR